MAEGCEGTTAETGPTLHSDAIDALGAEVKDAEVHGDCQTADLPEQWGSAINSPYKALESHIRPLMAL